MRTRNSLMNMFSAFGGQILAVLVGFIARLVFVRCLSQDYLGISSVFSSVLTLLSLAELGIGPAMTFAMYKPIAEGNIEQIKGLMQLYKKAYRKIGCVILALGIVFLPFYRLFIKSNTEFPHLDLIYFLYVLNTAISYFYSYKRSILEANQKKYKYNILHYAVYSIVNIAQAIALIITHSYIVYLLVQIGFTWLENVLVSKMADREYPFLLDKKVQELPKTITNPIWKNVKAMIFHKIGKMVVQSTDTLLMSTYFGLGASAIYANYILVSNAISTIASQIFGSITASVGNLSASEDKDKMYEVFRRLFFMNAWLYGFVTICFISLYQTFIELFFGKQYLFDFLTVVMFSISFYTSGMRQTVNVYKDANGLYYKDWYKPIIESVVNLGASIILLKKFGPSGIFIGTIVSNLFVSTWIEAVVLYKFSLQRSVLLYFWAYIKYTIVTIIICFVVSFGNLLFTGWGVKTLVLKTIFTVVSTNVLYIICYHKNILFIYFMKLTRNIVFSAITKVKGKI